MRACVGKQVSVATMINRVEAVSPAHRNVLNRVLVDPITKQHNPPDAGEVQTKEGALKGLWCSNQEVLEFRKKILYLL